jgi:putative oxidoreductase
MAVFTAVAALIAHQFWQLERAASAAQHIQFIKNLAIIGGFLYLFVAGPGPFSLDRRGR